MDHLLTKIEKPISDTRPNHIKQMQYRSFIRFGYVYTCHAMPIYTANPIPDSGTYPLSLSLCRTRAYRLMQRIGG
jgi:hypothetical protein